MPSCREKLFGLDLSFAQNAGLILARYLKEQSDGDDGERKSEWERLAVDLLGQALPHWGIGGKTSGGYGTGELKGVIAAPAVPQNPLIGKTVEARYIGKNKKGNLQFEAEAEGERIKAGWEEGNVPKVQETVRATVVSYSPRSPGRNPTLILRPLPSSVIGYSESK
jgi:hypothetical protein